MTLSQGHIPVLLNSVLEYIGAAKGGFYLDGTFGGGGHTEGLLQANEKTQVVSVDCDPLASERFSLLQKKYGKRVKFYDLNFGDLHLVKENEFDGVLFDLGVSSYQLDTSERGFSFRGDGPNDMRLNPRSGMSAAEFLEKAPERELIEAIRDLGEERHWKKAVRAILSARGTGVLARTQFFADLMAKAVGGRRGRIHPATKIFQGIRMKINDELGVLTKALPVAFQKLKTGGVLLVIAFHSLEDRLVKRFFKKMAGKPEHRYDDTPAEEREAFGKLLTTKPIVPTEEEVQKNPRSRSAKLRVLQKGNASL